MRSVVYRNVVKRRMTVMLTVTLGEIDDKELPFSSTRHFDFSTPFPPTVFEQPT